MNDERELERHNRILEQIKNAKEIDELPKIGFPTIASYLASNVYFDGRKISQKLFQPVIDEVIKHGYFAHQDVKNALLKVIAENYPDISDEMIFEKYKEISNSKRIGYILIEISEKNIKLDEIIKSINLNNHKLVIEEINLAFDVKDLPKVGLSELNRKISRAANDNDFINNIKISELKELTIAFLEHKSYQEVEKVVEQIVDKYSLSDEDKELMKEQILGSLILDETIEYTIEEIELKEQRKLQIYKINHEYTMDAIKESHRISQLPSNLTVSTVNSYLNGNTTIYSNDDRIKSEDLRNLTDLLMTGRKWEDQVVIDEVKKIADEKYPDKEDAFDLLYTKLSKLPRTYYLVEEVKYSAERQVEFIGRGSSNVNVYFIPNNKSPIEGGRFYNCYINRVGNLDLSQILPLDLDSIVPPDMDIDSIEWYVQEHADETFKTAGGIILNRDETIGNVSVFRPNDGTIGVSPEEKEKMDKINDLDVQINEKQDELSKLDSDIITKKQTSSELDANMKKILIDYEKKALALQKELITQISELKNNFVVISEENTNEEITDEDTSEKSKKKGTNNE